jgi:hypothetical protein
MAHIRIFRAAVAVLALAHSATSILPRTRAPRPMSRKTLPCLAVASLACVLLLFFSETTAASEPGWTNQVIARGEFRERIRSTPMEQRPYRPLHFYGNTVRRLHYRGTPLPTLGEVVALPIRLVVPR